MAKRRYAIRTDGLIMTIAVKNYLKKEKLLESTDVETISKEFFVTVPIGLVRAIKMAFYIGIMKSHYHEKAEILQEAGA